MDTLDVLSKCFIGPTAVEATVLQLAQNLRKVIDKNNIEECYQLFSLYEKLVYIACSSSLEGKPIDHADVLEVSTFGYECGKAYYDFYPEEWHVAHRIAKYYQMIVSLIQSKKLPTDNLIKYYEESVQYLAKVYDQTPVGSTYRLEYFESYVKLYGLYLHYNQEDKIIVFENELEEKLKEELSHKDNLSPNMYDTLFCLYQDTLCLLSRIETCIDVSINKESALQRRINALRAYKG